eukprot:CAMPEP_0205927800 /NCGR_PEP_ID=MMETSP1325-20131115/23395_1 /ASSEMBLY_ACC=CAM_ASM_000708 /TAXON_ID=236786 /ORGANISM="Florenciella sp., Strain RCC1007" /LENGTH=86 /DNA_ID=CAMNT_0053296737 /DNA_START=29 /DNA_END=289 /DNA_ORIENTATION=+
MREHLDVCISFLDHAVPELARRLSMERALVTADDDSAADEQELKKESHHSGALDALDLHFDRRKTTIHGYTAAEPVVGTSGGTVVG